MSEMKLENAKPVEFKLGQRRGKYFDAASVLEKSAERLDSEYLEKLERFDLIYRTLCGTLYNYVPMSGHPGGSISSGRFVNYLIYNNLDFNYFDPDSMDADVISYAAGHKALGLYAAWALRDEIMRIAGGGELPERKYRLRLEDLLGFRRNATEDTPLFKEFHTKPLDGHPSPLCPFVKLSTGASGVGLASSVGLAFGMMDTYGKDNPPKLHVIEGEGGLTAGRAHEAIAGAASAGISNIIMHLDWNQASIDSNNVCREGDKAGDYVQWSPAELFYLHDWNVIYVEDGFDWNQIAAAQNLALKMDNGQPTAIIYRTVKGWHYGLEGRASHGAGHKYCSEEFYKNVVTPFKEAAGMDFCCATPEDKSPEAIEAAYWDMLLHFREALEKHADLTSTLAKKINDAKSSLEAKKREVRAGVPDVSKVYDENTFKIDQPPEGLDYKPGDSVTLRGALGDGLGEINKASGGALMALSADLLDSTSVSKAAKHFPKGLYHSVNNPDSRLLAMGGICEDAIGGAISGISAYGNHIGISASYAAFIAALQHISVRLHAIGQQARNELSGQPFNPLIMINGHAGVRTGEDGPTHADVQALQLLQGNFPRGTSVTLTPWEAGEIWPLMLTTLRKRPAIIAPFVTRPADTVVDREALNLPPVTEAVKGIWPVRSADPQAEDYCGTIVLQGSDVMGSFITGVLPELDARGYKMNIYYVSSLELFELLPEDERNAIYPDARAAEAMAITGFTLPTMYKWIGSEKGRSHSVSPFKKGRFLSSGKADRIMREAGIDAEAQLAEVEKYIEEFKKGF